jgi:hypothetical protein
MRAVANSPKFAKKVGVSQSVGKDFEMADKKAKKFGDGGSARKAKLPSQNYLAERLRKAAEGPENRSAESLQRGAIERANREQAREANIPKRAKGGVMKKATKAGRALVKKSADTMGRAMVKKAGGGKCYAKGGSVASKRADGCAIKGKTKGKMLAMGGMAGRGMMAEDMGGPAMMNMPGYKKGGKTGYKRGGKTC